MKFRCVRLSNVQTKFVRQRDKANPLPQRPVIVHSVVHERSIRGANAVTSATPATIDLPNFDFHVAASVVVALTASNSRVPLPRFGCTPAVSHSTPKDQPRTLAQQGDQQLRRTGALDQKRKATFRGRCHRSGLHALETDPSALLAIKILIVTECTSLGEVRILLRPRKSTGMTPNCSRFLKDRIVQRGGRES